MPTETRPELTVLIPAHNEEKRMDSCLQRLTDFLSLNHPSSEIVISEDGSTDRTVQIVREFRSKRQTIPLVLLTAPRRLGKGGGLKRGLEVARGEYTVFTDTDLPVPLVTITKSVALLRNGADVVAGSRVIKGAARNEPFRRKALSSGFHALARIMLGMKWDSQCGFKAVRTKIGREAFARMENPGFAYDVDFLIQAKRLGARIVEMPVQWHYNRDTSMRLSRDVIGMFKELMHIFVQARLRASR